MSYDSFLEQVKQATPGIDVRDKYIRPALYNFYHSMPTNPIPEQDKIYAELWSSAFFAGRRSVQVPSRELLSGLARKLASKG